MRRRGWTGLRSGVRDDDFMLGSWSNRLFTGGCNSGISRCNLEFRTSWQAQYFAMLQGDSCCSARCTGRFMWNQAQSSESFFVAGGRRNIWWTWRVTLVALRIALDVSCETRINHQSHSWWQAQYFVMLEGDSCCSAQCTGPFMWDKNQSSECFFMAGAILGEVRGWLLLLHLELEVSCVATIKWKNSLCGVVLCSRDSYFVVRSSTV